MQTITSFSGGEVLMNAGEAKRPLRGTEVWNRDPLPPPPPPRIYTYSLLVVNSKYEATATAQSMEVLIAFNEQMQELGYEFIKLERMEHVEASQTNQIDEVSGE